MTLNISKNDIIKLIESDEKKDLHLHTIYSDGVLTPEQLVDRWTEEGNRIIAVTDHDGIGGSIVAVEYAKDKDIIVIPGIEFDSENELGRDLHILGYGIDFDNEELNSKLDNILEWREERNAEIIDILHSKGIDVTEEEINAINDGRYIGKPTFARVLVNRGMYPNMRTAFEYLFSNEPRIKSIVKRTFTSREIVETIHQAGGIAILAHPMEQMRTGETFEEYEPRLLQLLDTFVEYGVDGIECYHPSASPEQAEYFRKYAEDRGLLITRGSDFHYDGLSRRYTKD